MENKVFLDTAFVIALISQTDKYHQVALQLSEQLTLSRTQIVTTRAIIFEIGNALSKQQYRTKAIHFLKLLESDPQIEIVPITEELYVKAFNLFSSHHDKSWGLVDCLSFVVMRQRDIISALTTDHHFQQAGFRALLLEP
ncbi:conserved hypothetical protein [Beggiatoa sp. PS]|nr:conserved hypothetical protein [Beggiatoa sp. PS]